VWRGLVYLLVTLLTLPLPFVRTWATGQRRRAGRLLGRPAGGAIGFRRALTWLCAHVAIGLPAGLVALVCAGNLVATVVTVPLWWAFPADVRLRFLLDGPPLSGWGAALGLGVVQVAVFAALTYWLVPSLARFHARACLALLSPSVTERLAERVDVLTQTRTAVLDAHGAELRRIERDLHDGTQARLVAIAMRLGVAQEVLTDNPERVAELLKEAHEGAEAAMTELREVIRTIYPPILADRGLTSALSALATQSGVPARLDVGDLGTVPAAVEAVAYYAVAEALTNVTKHSGATEATVRLSRRDARLSIEIADNGVGGADPEGGTGIAGIHRRAAALDGIIRLQSPAGGPTTLTVDLPCGS
jgi:signal transduction histidine kinase